MQVRRVLPLAVWLMAVWLHGCAGGSGSSGFDVSAENTAIQQVLNEQRCIARDGLTICPAGPTAGPPTPTPTATRPPTALATATVTATAGATPAATATRVATPAPSSPPPAATATPRSGAPGVDTALDGATSVVCTQVGADAPCTFVLPFVPFGFPADAVYAVAVRLDSNGRWSVGPALTANGPAQGSSFDAPVAVPATQAPAVTVQLAVLVFLPPAPALPEEVQQLADSGASFAFVTPEVALQAQAAGSP